MKPGDFPLRSCQSRAAARAALERRRASRRRIDIVSSVLRPGADRGIRVGTWIECDDRSLFRFSTIPAGMTIEEAERIVAKRERKPRVAPVSACQEAARACNKSSERGNATVTIEPKNGKNECKSCTGRFWLNPNISVRLGK